MTIDDDKPEPHVSESGITARDVDQRAGRDATGRDKIDNRVQIFLRGFGKPRTPTAAELAERDQQLLRFRHRVLSIFQERRDQAEGVEGLSPPLERLPQVRRLGLDEYVSGARDQALTPSETVASFFRDTCVPGNESLLLLGEPGAGKTTALLDLGIRLGQTDYPQVPAYVPLSNWTQKVEPLARIRSMFRGRERLEGSPLAQWLTDRIAAYYRVDREHVKNWLLSGQLLLLFDGLDEIRELKDRNACAEQITEFMALYPGSSVITSRVAEYDALTAELSTDYGLLIRPLNKATVRRALRDAGPSLAGVYEAVTGDEELLELCQTPLLLSIVMETYRGGAVESVKSYGTTEQRREQMLDAYVDRQLSLSSDVKQTREQSRHWLSSLARALERQDPAILQFERLGPAWLSSSFCKLINTVTPPMIAVPTLVIAGYPWYASALMGIAALVLSFTDWAAASVSWSPRAVGPDMLILGVCGGIGFSWVASRQVLGADVNLFDFSAPAWPGFLIFGVPLGLVGGLVLGGLGPSKVPVTHTPYQALVGWLRNSLIIAISVGIAYVALGWIVLEVTGTVTDFGAGQIPGLSEVVSSLVYSSLAFAFLALLLSGFARIVVALSARVLMSVEGAAPFSYVKWLDEMVRIRLLYRVGGGYVFIHIMVRNLLATEAGSRRD